MTDDNTPNPVDIFVGKKLRQLRTLKGLTQQKLAEAVGVTFQQIQKYERGTNRVGASRLYDLSKILTVPVGSFFDGIGRIDLDAGTTKTLRVAESTDEPTFDADPLQRKETIDLIRFYYQIRDPELRKSVMDLAKSLAKSALDE